MTAPTLEAPRFENIPAALRAQKRWAPWRATWNAKRGKYDKVPVTAAGANLSTARAAGWTTFEEALLACVDGGFAGVGYRMTGPHGFVGIDLDNCVQAGVVAPWALAIVKACESYAEVSPSGNGIRIFVRGSIDADWTNHDQGIEVYGGNAPRFLTVTGITVPGSTDDVREAPAGVLDDLARQYAKRREKADVIDISMPAMLEDSASISHDGLALPAKVKTFLDTGDADDRSGALHAAGVALYSLGLDDAQVLTLLHRNQYAWQVALDHRRQDEDRALAYLWREHCVKAKAKALAAVASADDFDATGPGIAAARAAPAASTALVAAGGGGGGGRPPTTVYRTPTGTPDPAFQRKNNGQVVASLENVVLAIADTAWIGCTVGYDDYLAEVMIAHRPGQWVPFRDTDYGMLKMRCEQGGAKFEDIPFGYVKAAVAIVAEQNRFDSAQTWAREHLPEWDGVPRIDTFLHAYFGAEDNAYTRACSRMLWASIAGRILEPGCKVDGVVILVGPQGVAKSISVKALAPSNDFFTEVNLLSKEDDLLRQMKGRLIGEIGELRGLRQKEIDHIKSFVSRQVDEWTPKYVEKVTRYPRRCVLIGTTNNDEFLHDDSGERRWFPVDVVKGRPDDITRDRLQLYAEATMHFTVHGCEVDYYEANGLAAPARNARKVREAWTDAIAEWLATPDDLTGATPATCKTLQTRDIARDALRIEAKAMGKAEEQRIGRAMRELGWERARVYVDGRLCRVWQRNVTNSK